MKVLITGSTGLVGTALVQELRRAGHTVCRLVRPKSGKGSESLAMGFDVTWDPATGELGGAAVGADAVVNLAGASIAEGRWTLERKELLRSSRVETTCALVKALARMNERPRVLVSASAIGCYGNRGDELLTETSALGDDFLSSIAKEWEAEANKAEVLGIRVVNARFGVILANQGGALAKMLPPFRMGAGGRLGSGKQWMSWITLEDTIGALLLAIENIAARGPLNFVSPQPVQNLQFTKVLAAALHRPAIFPVPAFGLRLAMGEMADALLLSSQRVLPKRLESLGYKFLQPDLSSALRAALAPR